MRTTWKRQTLFNDYTFYKSLKQNNRIIWTNQRDKSKIFLDQIYSEPSKSNYKTNKLNYNHMDEIWSIDLPDMIHYKVSNKKFSDTFHYHW